jgi:hypothetical protein
VVVSGDTVVAAAVNALITTGGAFYLPPVALANERRIAICFAWLELLSKVNLNARIASGTDNPGHRNKKAKICAMCSSTRQPLPDMFRKIFGQWESRLDGQWTSNC